jgi:5'-nucleotidase
MNINFPNRAANEPIETRFVAQGRRESDYNLIALTDPRGQSYYWIGPPSEGALLRGGETDYHAIEDGAVTVTPLHMDLTHEETLRRLKETLS